MASAPWRRVVVRGLGNGRAVQLGLGLVLVGVLGKLLLLSYANFETVFVACLLAGSLLGRWYTVLVPLAVLLILQPLYWGALYPNFALEAMAGISFFVVTGYLFVGLAGRGLKPRVLFRIQSVALLTTVSVPLTVAYDLWTDVGEWYFLARPAGIGFVTVLQLQFPFTLIHLLSSLIFVPLFGSIFLVLAHQPVTLPRTEAHPWDEPEP